jgi:hypothetical protein
MRTLAGTLIVTLALLSTLAAQKRGRERIITESITLEKNAVIKTPLVIKASRITIDGNGATLQGPGRPGDKKSFTGVGIRAAGCSRVTLKNLHVRGFERGLEARDGEEWRIESCDFSDNYHDPDYGWGDYRRVGGMILTRISRSHIVESRANRVWNGLDLSECDRNVIEKNDFSHCSNVCLKLWTSSHHRVVRNNLSHGIRIRPGEVHARDSTCVLIESGSNGNRFEKNDITHGGDGVFIRVLNGWVSTGNVFIENDCSHANNNGFEAWSPGNTYLRNRSNHCSYGFWLGGSDQTVLIGNEAAYNGMPDGHHNAPEPDFRHGGIVIVNGPGSHTLIDGNHCHHNAGAGIVFRGDRATRGAKWKMFHLIVQRNRLEHNRTGLFVRFTDWLDLGGNTFRGNDQDEFLEEVTNLFRHEADPEKRPPPEVVLKGPSRSKVGVAVTFDASASRDPSGLPLTFRWDVGGTVLAGPVVEHAFTEPGFYRVGLTVHNGHLGALAYRDFYVVGRAPETATEGHAKKWGFTMANNADGRGRVTITDDPTAIVGRRSVKFRVDPYKGHDVALILASPRGAPWNLTRKTHLTFWLKFRNSNNGGFQGPNPIVRLRAGDAALAFTPAYRGMPRNALGDLPYSEARWGWLHVRLPLSGGESWLRAETIEGEQPPHVDHALRFETARTGVPTQGPSALASDGTYLYLASLDHRGRLWKTRSGGRWKPLKRPADDLKGAGGDWINGMLAFHGRAGKKGSLYLALRHPERDRFGHDCRRLARYDIATDTWSWLPTQTAMGHGAAVVGDWLYGLAHAVGGNYGGPFCRANLVQPAAFDERSVIGPLEGDNAWWMSRAAQLAAVDGRIFGIKNDWKTPQPEASGDIGDRLFVIEASRYAPSKFAGGDRWSDKQWKAATTPAVDLEPLPFEVGHGASLVALPPRWCSSVGAKGGLFIAAGCSPSNHEGYGPPSDRYALFDLEKRKFIVGRLPGPTGTGTSAALHGGKLYVKRGGMNHGPTNRELWIVTPLKPSEARTTTARLERQRFDLRKVERLSLQFDSMGYAPFEIRVDGLRFE